MKKLLSLVVAGGLILAACSPGGGGVAATVDGTDITVGEVEDLIYVESGTIPRERFAEFLSFSIQWDILAAAAEADYGFAPTEEEVTAEADNIFEMVPDKPEGQTREEFLQERGVTEEFLLNIGRQGLTDVFVRGELEAQAPDPTEEELAEAQNAARASLTEVCVSHILVGTEDEAQDVQGRLESGEEFGELASEVSTDPSAAENGGVLPCTSADQYVVAFRDAVLVAPVGEVYPDIVESNFGFHLVLVTDRQDANEEDLPDDAVLIEGFKDGWVGEELLAWFNGIMAAATVTVDPEYGIWSPSGQNGPTIIPPQG